MGWRKWEYKWRLTVALSEGQNHRCAYCGCVMAFENGHPYSLTFDHVVPKSHGGISTRDNGIAACAECNNLRTDMDPYVFYGWVQNLDHETVQRLSREHTAHAWKHSIHTLAAPPPSGMVRTAFLLTNAKTDRNLAFELWELMQGKYAKAIKGAR